MFVGHYGPSFAGKAIEKSIPLWVLFLAVQLLDVFWSILVLLGIEKVRIVPGITKTNPLDLITCHTRTAWTVRCSCPLGQGLRIGFFAERAVGGPRRSSQPLFSLTGYLI